MLTHSKKNFLWILALLLFCKIYSNGKILVDALASPITIKVQFDPDKVLRSTERVFFIRLSPLGSYHPSRAASKVVGSELIVSDENTFYSDLIMAASPDAAPISISVQMDESDVRQSGFGQFHQMENPKIVSMAERGSDGFILYQYSGPKNLSFINFLPSRKLISHLGTL